jgi:hypothetical protein
LVPLFLELASPHCQRNGEIVNFREWRSAHRNGPAAETPILNADL